ncbi:hypothetical protein V8F20_010364 [Naviculisporaceae sp. PSN 640]
MFQSEGNLANVRMRPGLTSCIMTLTPPMALALSVPLILIAPIRLSQASRSAGVFPLVLICRLFLTNVDTYPKTSGTTRRLSMTTLAIAPMSRTRTQAKSIFQPQDQEKENISPSSE